MRISTAYNSGFAKAGVLCFYESFVLNSTFVLLMKFSARNPRLRKAAKRQAVKIPSFRIYFTQIASFQTCINPF